MNRQVKSNKSHRDTDKVHWSEWLAGGLSGVLVVLLLGWLVYHSYQFQTDEADFRVEVTGSTGVENGYRVAFSVFNLSRSSAAQVRVVGTLGEKDENAEYATATFDYVASQAQSSGALFFMNNPRTHGVQLRVVSYIEP